MDILLVVIIGIALSMDAFAVSITFGLCNQIKNTKDSIKVGATFGIFQGVMPLIGFLVSYLVLDYITHYSGYIAFIILAIVGANMIREGAKKENKLECISIKKLFILGFATSIDALVTGFSLSLMNINIYLAVIIIGFVTFFVCFLGTKIGKLVSIKFKHISEILGGIVLILIGIKFLIETL